MKLIQKYSHCFVCGDKNDIGLKVAFFEEEGKAKAEFVSTARLEGYKDILHGGILAALLDEVMIKSIIAKGILTVTSHLEVEFRKPAKIGEKLFLEGKIKNEKGKMILTEGKVFRENGDVIARARGKYFKVKEEMRRILNRSLDG